MTINDLYLRSKWRQNQAEKAKVRDSIQSRNKAFEDSFRTKLTRPVDMKDAYKEVLGKNYKPTPEETHYRRFTSGSWIDCP